MELKAIYRVIPANRVRDFDTLVYNIGSGFAWVRPKDGTVDNWHTYNATAVGAEQDARRAGFDPQAVYYIRELV